MYELVRTQKLMCNTFIHYILLYYIMLYNIILFRSFGRANLSLFHFDRGIWAGLGLAMANQVYVIYKQAYDLK